MINYPMHLKYSRADLVETDPEFVKSLVWIETWHEQMLQKQEKLDHQAQVVQFPGKGA